MTIGYADVLVGLQYGDEGKAKIIDFLSPQYDIIARFNGGANAGHTIMHNGTRLLLRQVPSGVHHRGCRLYIGSGCVINLAKLVEEITSLEATLGVSIRHRLVISPHATVVQPHHMLLDEYFSKEISTTKNGIGPAYADRSIRTCRGLRRHIRIGDLLSYPDLISDMERNLSHEMQELGVEGISPELEIQGISKSFEIIKDLIATDPLWLTKEVKSGATVLFEGAQSVLLDVLHGTVPYVTGSHTIAAGAFVGGDLPASYLRKTIGVAKAVMSRVGHGPFPSEYPGYVESLPGVADMRAYEAQHFDAQALLLSGDRASVGRALRIIGGEYGSVTGRPRRIGALDLKALHSAVLQNGVNEVYLTKCDILEQFWNTPRQEIDVVTDYGPKRESSAKGKWCREHAAIFESRPAFPCCLTERKSCSLDGRLASFIQEIEGMIGAPIVGLGIGRERTALLLHGADGAWHPVGTEVNDPAVSSSMAETLQPSPTL